MWQATVEIISVTAGIITILAFFFGIQTIRGLRDTLMTTKSTSQKRKADVKTSPTTSSTNQMESDNEAFLFPLGSCLGLILTTTFILVGVLLGILRSLNYFLGIKFDITPYGFSLETFIILIGAGMAGFISVFIVMFAREINSHMKNN